MLTAAVAAASVRAGVHDAFVRRSVVGGNEALVLRRSLELGFTGLVLGELELCGLHAQAFEVSAVGVSEGQDRVAGALFGSSSVLFSHVAEIFSDALDALKQDPAAAGL